MAALLGEEWPEEEAPRLWNASLQARGALGYKDNVLLSPHTPEGSGFWLTAVDLFLFRLPDRERDLEATFFLSAEDVRFFSVKETDQEQLIFGRAEVARSAGGGKASVGLDYVYQDQVFDASATELELSAVRARGHTLTWTPGWTMELGRSWSVELELPAGRQWYSGELDSYWEAGPRLTVGREWSRSAVGVEYTPQWRLYDSRMQVSREAFLLPGTSLRYLRHRVALSWRQHWDEQKRWRSFLRVGYDRNLDNGSGYFDYHRVYGTLRWSYEQAAWETLWRSTVSAYFYELQRGDGGSRAREKLTWSTELELRRRLARHWKLFTIAGFEQSFSNAALDEYRTWRVAGGVELTWDF